MISRDLVASQLGEEAEEVVSCGVRKKIINSAFFEYPGPRGPSEFNFVRIHYSRFTQ